MGIMNARVEPIEKPQEALESLAEQRAIYMDRTEQKIIRITQVIEIVGLSRASIYRMMAKQTFPNRRKLGESAVGWHYHEIQEWIISRREA